MSRWGFGSAVHGTASVGTASTAVLAANPNRTYAIISNDGTAAVYLALGKAAVLNEGIRLSPGGTYGDRLEMSRDKSNVFSGAINGISAVAGMKVIAIQGESLNPN